MQSKQQVQAVAVARLAELAEGVLRGSGDYEVSGVATLVDADAASLAPVAESRYLAAARSSSAGALLVHEQVSDQLADDARPQIVVPDVPSALVAILEVLYRQPMSVPGVHPTAVLGRDVRLGADVSIGPYAVLGSGAQIGDGTAVGAHCVVGEGVEIGHSSVLHAHVVIYAGVRIGSRVIVHSGARLGVDGFGYAWTAQGHRKIPQVGLCLIGDDVEIGANTCIDRGSIGNTELSAGVKIDNLVHLAHNVKIGEHSAMAALVGVAGSTQVGRGVFMGGQSGVIGHLEIGDGARIAAATKVLKSVGEGETWSGNPARPNREYLRRQAQVNRLPRTLERLTELEAEVARLRARYIEDSEEKPGHVPDSPSSGPTPAS